MSVSVRDLVSDDLPALAALVQAHASDYPFDDTETRAARLMSDAPRNADDFVLGAWDSGELVGLLLVAVDDGTAELLGGPCTTDPDVLRALAVELARRLPGAVLDAPCRADAVGLPALVRLLGAGEPTLVQRWAHPGAPGPLPAGFHRVTPGDDAWEPLVAAHAANCPECAWHLGDGHDFRLVAPVDQPATARQQYAVLGAWNNDLYWVQGDFLALIRAALAVADPGEVTCYVEGEPGLAQALAAAGFELTLTQGAFRVTVPPQGGRRRGR